MKPFDLKKKLGEGIYNIKIVVNNKKYSHKMSFYSWNPIKTDFLLLWVHS